MNSRFVAARRVSSTEPSPRTTILRSAVEYGVTFYDTAEDATRMGYVNR